VSRISVKMSVNEICGHDRGEKVVHRVIDETCTGLRVTIVTKRSARVTPAQLIGR
jgi:hypothetical protein